MSDLNVTPGSGGVERSEPVGVPWVDRAARCEERRDQGGVTLRSGLVEQCASVRILLVDVHPKLREQSPNRVGVNPGAAAGRGTTALPSISNRISVLG